MKSSLVPVLFGGESKKFKGLFDLFGVSEIGLSPRLLQRNYSGGLIEAVAEKNGTQYGTCTVLPYRVSKDEYRIDLNSPIENFVENPLQSRTLPSDARLGEFLDVGVSGQNYNGKTQTIYNQGILGSVANLTQTGLSAMPIFAESGELVTENGKPTFKFDGVDDFVSAAGIDQRLNDYSFFSLMNTQSTSDWVSFANGSNLTNEGGFQMFGNSSNRYRPSLWNNASSNLTHPALGLPEFRQISVIGERSNLSSFYSNKLIVSTLDISSFELIDLVNNGNLEVGRGLAYVNRYFKGSISEIIFSLNNFSSKRTQIEQNQMDYCGIS